MSVAAFLAAGLSGLLLAAAFPWWNLWVLAWVGLIPLLWAVRDRSPREAALIGWFGGCLHYGLLLYWLVPTMKSYGGLPIAVGVAVLLLLSLYLGAFWALFGAVLAKIRSTLRLGLLAAAPALWCALEALRGVLFTGFPWALLGYSQWRQVHITQVADLAGVYGVSFLLVSINCALLGLLEMPPDKRTWRRWRPVGEAALAAALLVAALVYGSWRIPQVMAASALSAPIRVGIAQGNIEQSLKWDPAFQEATVRIYEDQTRELARQGAQVVVWPETAAPFFFRRDEVWKQRLLNLATETGVEVLFGSPALEGRGERSLLFNRAYLIGRDGRIRGYYDKMHLVPFGEYVPLKELLFFVHHMVASVGDLSPGKNAAVLSSATGASIGVMICFESIFPEISRAFSRRGGDLLANLTNDAWYGDTAGPYQHLSLLTMRAVENRRWIVRAANTGISAFVDPVGRVVSEISLMRAGVLVDKVRPLRLISKYTYYGDRFVQACALWTGGLFVLSLILSLLRRRAHGFP